MPVDRAHRILRLQRTIGNQAVQRMLQTAHSPHQIQSAQAIAGQVGVPTLVNDVLAGPGKSLDASTGAFMERRFGREFAHVRVHADAAAAASAQAIDALAYTSGHHIVFGAEQYAPHAPAGRRLLAHELTHVVQQTAPGAIRRQPTPDPGPGKYTPKGYEEWLKKHPKRVYRIGGPWEPDYLAKRYTPKWFADYGYYYAGRGGVVPHNWFEVWLSDNGDGAEYRVWHSTFGATNQPAKPESTQPPGKEPLSPGEQITARFPDRLDPNADHEKLFGPVIAERLDADSVFGDGDLLLHRDGTVVLHLTGRNKSIVLRPGPKGLYIVYWEDGHRDRMPYRIPPSEIPDPVKDATD